jgi:K(+)-stimulated pyrophosphate-energized sodium pump
MAYFDLQNGWVPFAFLTVVSSPYWLVFWNENATYASARTANAAKNSLNNG